MKPEAMNIIKMISKPYNQRMPFQGVQLTKFIQKLPFFKRFFPYQSEKFISLCLSSYLLQFQAGEDLYCKQTKPDLIYIVVEGQVQVQSKQSKVVREVHSYDLIGHVQVVFNLNERGQITKALAHTYCMVINAQKFKKVWQKQEQIEKAYHYLLSNKYFESLSEYDKKHLSLMMIKSSFKEGQTLISAGSINQKIFYIIYGQVYVIKKLKIRGVEKEVILESLQQMDSFGQFEAINKITNEVTLKAASTGTYYSIVITEPLEVKHPFVELAKEKGLPYPEKEELQFRFEVQTEVEKYKSEIKKKLHLYR